MRPAWRLPRAPALHVLEPRRLVAPLLVPRSAGLAAAAVGRQGGPGASYGTRPRGDPERTARGRGSTRIPFALEPAREGELPLVLALVPPGRLVLPLPLLVLPQVALVLELVGLAHEQRDARGSALLTGSAGWMTESPSQY